MRVTILTVRAFGSPGDAPRFVGDVEHLSASDLWLHDAAVVAWPDGAARPIAWQVNRSDARRLSGAFWGLLFAHLFLLPLSRDPATGPAGADRALDHLGITADVVERLRGRTGTGSVAFLLHDAEADEALIAVPVRAGEPATALTIHFTDVQVRRLQAGFAGAPSGCAPLIDRPEQEQS